MRGIATFLVVSGAAALLAGPALAHHPMEGVPMTTFWHGLLSGFGHPILGYDHLFFVAAVGLAARFTAQPLLAPLYYVVSMCAGVGLAAAGLSLPLVELIVAVSLLTVGGIIAAGRPVLPLLFAAFGVFHGLAFGEVLAEQEATQASVLAGYLVGLAATQWAVALAAGWTAATVFSIARPTDLAHRLAGAVVFGVGVALTMEMAISLV